MGTKIRYNAGIAVGLRLPPVSQPVRKFHWRRRWRQVVPHLQDPEVQLMLDAGMTVFDLITDKPEGMRWKSGDAPYTRGNGTCASDRRDVEKGDLRWYQPWGRCHFIAPFAWAIGRKLYPQLIWKCIASDRHTTAIGVTPTNIPRVVMDILLFRQLSAEGIIGHSCWGNNPQLVDHPRDIYTGRETTLTIPE